MKNIFLTAFIAIIFLISGCAKNEVKDPIKDPEIPPVIDTGYGDGKIVVCGSKKVYIINLKNSTSKEQDIEWEWSADKATDIPDIYKTKHFNNMDECKPSRDGKKLYVTSSSGGVGVINIADKKMLFYAFVPQAHSIEELPNDKLAVISSTHVDGNAIDIFDINQNEKSLYRVGMESGHGLVWYNSKRILYALGGKELRAYELKDWETDNPSLLMLNTWSQPGNGGHDLVPLPDTSALIISDTQNVYSFDLTKNTFSVYGSLTGYKNIKSISINKKDGRILYMSPEESWWAFHVRILKPYHSIPIPNMNVYKTRWLNVD